MNMSLRYPNITGRTEQEQLAQVNSYLRQMVDQLNFALQNQGGGQSTVAAGKDGKDGRNGADGKTPKKGVDYWTAEDVRQIVDAAVEGVLKEKVKILEASMPVGYLYASNSPTDPKTLFGFGTWEQIEDRFPLAAGSTYAAGSTGGEAEHTLTTAELPDMGKFLSLNWHNQNSYNTGIFGDGGMKTQDRTFGSGTSCGEHWTTASGGKQPHNNMPPYYAMYMWIRTA